MRATVAHGKPREQTPVLGNEGNAARSDEMGRKAIDALKDRIRRSTRRSGGRSITQVVAELRQYLPGWSQYFALAETPQILGSLDKWLRHRLRALHLKQWKRGRTVFREMRSRGASVDVAAQVAANTRRWWSNSAMYLQTVLTTRYFDALGVPRLRPATSTSRTARCGPARRVVWGAPG
jgi:hypothetical protein